jgi:hypothetical protein
VVGTRTLGWTVSSITLKLRVELGAGVGVDRHAHKRIVPAGPDLRQDLAHRARSDRSGWLFEYYETREIYGPNSVSPRESRVPRFHPCRRAIHFKKQYPQSQGHAANYSCTRVLPESIPG